jgi:hypothetical protein
VVENIIFVGGNRVDRNFPSVLYPVDALEEEGYEVRFLSLQEGFEQVSEEGLLPQVEEWLDGESAHLVGYCAGGVLAYQHIDHPGARSFTGYDVPGGLTLESNEIGLDEPVERDDVFMVYAESIGNRPDGSYPVSEVKATGHEFEGREQQLADAVVSGIEYHEGASLEQVEQRLDGEVTVFENF